MKARLFAILSAFTFAFLIPAISLAADDDAPVIDARLQGYQSGNMALKDAAGTGLTWLLLIILGAICIGVLFMTAKRTHLD